MSIELGRIVEWCHHTLAVDAFRDYCPNGLQVEANTHVTKVISAVSASQSVIELAIQAEADLLLVHHGYFWKGEDPALTGMKAARIRQLMRHGISLLAYHLPLDAHPTLGNNAALAQQLGFEITGALNPAESHPIGNVGECLAMSAAEMTLHLSQQLGRPALHLEGRSDIIQRVGWCTGAAQDMIHLAHAQGCDAYISGEVSERTFYEAQELGIHYFACGHHATERGGVQRLGQALSEEFAIPVQFVDTANPI
ncbi:MAG: Nif3-like dinuclear metal center hexameric protein [Pseudomonadota bacterium]|nr:Nif3-like dinuclear metal center hexameric protein [Pseudomonadota bacterium]